MENNDKQFTITLNERQLRLLAYACRVTDRLIIGQLDFSLQECCESAFEKLHKDDKAKRLVATIGMSCGLLSKRRYKRSANCAGE